MLGISVKDRRINIGERFSVEFQRTLRIPDDDQIYPLPPGLGDFPVNRVADYLDRVPDHWKKPNSFFISMYQREALWLCFNGADWKPNAVKLELAKSMPSLVMYGMKNCMMTHRIMLFVQTNLG
jgi:hypothetical protein